MKTWRQFLYTLFVIPLVLLQRTRELVTATQMSMPSELLLNAVTGKVTSDIATSFVVATKCIVFLVLFMLLYGDTISSQQRTVAVFRFSRMPSRIPWYCKNGLKLGVLSGIYCGMYVGLHMLISLHVACNEDSLSIYHIACNLWRVFTIVCWMAAIAGNILCGLYGVSSGFSILAMVMLLLAGISTFSEIPQWVQLVNPISFPENMFIFSIFTPKLDVMILEMIALFVLAGIYFCRKDIYSAEGDG